MPNGSNVEIDTHKVCRECGSPYISFWQDDDITSPVHVDCNNCGAKYEITFESYAELQRLDGNMVIYS